MVNSPQSIFRLSTQRAISAVISLISRGSVSRVSPGPADLHDNILRLADRREAASGKRYNDDQLLRAYGCSWNTVFKTMQNTRLSALDFDLGAETDMLRATVRDLRRRQGGAHRRRDRPHRRFPIELWPEMGALGLHGITVEEEMGGAGMGYLAHCVAMEEMSAGPRPRLGCPTARIPTFASTRSAAMARRRRNGSYLPKLICGEHVGALAMSEPRPAPTSSRCGCAPTRRATVMC